MECQGDTLARKVPPDPEDRRSRATWSFALLVRDGFGLHCCVQTEFDPCGAEGSRSWRLSRCWSPKTRSAVRTVRRARGLNLTRHPEGPIPLGLAAPGFAEPLTQHFGGGLAPADRPEDEGLPEALRGWSPRRGCPSSSGAQRRSHAPHLASLQPRGSRVAMRGTRRKHCAARI